VPTASGVPLQMLPKEINGVRIVGIDVPGFGVPTHAEAKDVLSGAMLPTRARKPSPAPCRRPRDGVETSPTVTLSARCSPPIR
jgi:chlorophyllide a reductase subunit Y